MSLQPAEQVPELKKIRSHESGRVTALGLRPNAEIFGRMREAYVVVITSRHGYLEGLPLTIYDALSSRTPIVAPHYSIFADALRHGESASVSAAGGA